MVLTTSRVGAYMACPRRHWWSYELGIRKERDGRSLTIGKAYHGALEAMNRGTAPDLAAASCRTADLDDVDREIAACMAAGWSWRWREAPQFAKVLAVEQVFEFRPVKSKRWSVAGKIDVIGELPDGRVAVGEYKTTTEDLSKGTDYWRRLLIDRQCSGYVLGARALGYPVDTVSYDACRLPGIRPRLLTAVQRKLSGAPEGTRESLDQYAERLMASIAEKPDWYYGREEIPRLDADLEEWRADMAHVVAMLTQSRKVNRWPRNTDACKRWGTCPYFNPCSASHDPTTQGVPSGFVKVEDVHVELRVNPEPEADYGDGNDSNSTPE